METTSAFRQVPVATPLPHRLVASKRRPDMHVLKATGQKLSAKPMPRRSAQHAPVVAAAAAAILAPTAAAAFAASPLQSILAGLTLGLAAHAKLSLTGRILGISGTVRGIVQGSGEAWRVAFVMGLLSGGLALRALLPGAFEALPAALSVQRVVLAGLLVGVGTSRGSGCTSGHGICGNARLSLRSFVATCTFMAAGAVVAWLTHSAAVFSLPQGIAPLVGGPTIGTTFGAVLLAAATATTLLLSLAAKRLAAPSRVASSFVLEAELKQASALEETSLIEEPPAAGRDAQKLAALSTAADLFIGFLFALGLGVSGMLKPSKVAGFLGVLSGTFDPSLMFVMAGALLVALPAFQLTLRSTEAPLCSVRYELPTRKQLDANLITGAIMFGAGWGLGGICPGPALVSLATLQPKIVLFVAAMVVGMRLDHAVDAGLSPRQAPQKQVA